MGMNPSAQPLAGLSGGVKLHLPVLIDDQAPQMPSL